MARASGNEACATLRGNTLMQHFAEKIGAKTVLVPYPHSPCGQAHGSMRRGRCTARATQATAGAARIARGSQVPLARCGSDLNGEFRSKNPVDAGVTQRLPVHHQELAFGIERIFLGGRIFGFGRDGFLLECGSFDKTDHTDKSAEPKTRQAWHAAWSATP